MSIRDDMSSTLLENLGRVSSWFDEIISGTSDILLARCGMEKRIFRGHGIRKPHTCRIEKFNCPRKDNVNVGSVVFVKQQENLCMLYYGNMF